MEEAEQRHLSMTLIFIMASSLLFCHLFLFFRRRSWQSFLKHLPHVFLYQQNPRLS